MAMGRSTRLVEFLSWILLHVTVLDCRNANIIASGISVTEGNSVSLSCIYTGLGTEISVVWYKGPGAAGINLTLKPNATAPGSCYVFGKSPSFDDSRVSHTCNSTGNIYTLDINPVRSEDNGTWSCTFQAPLTDSDTAEIMIQVTAMTTISTTATTTANTTTKPATTTTKTTTTKEILTLPVIIGVSVGGSVFILLISVIIICCCCQCCYLHHNRKERKKKKKQNAEEFTQIGHNLEANDHIKAKSGTPNTVYRVK